MCDDRDDNVNSDDDGNWLMKSKRSLSDQFNNARKLSNPFKRDTQDTDTDAQPVIEPDQDSSDANNVVSSFFNNVTQSIETHTKRLTSAITQIDTNQLKQNITLYHERLLNRDRSKKPGILVTGRTGAGKSTLINNFIGADVAPTGSGEPITQDFDLYDHEDLPVKIYDSPGWEGGKEQAKSFMEGTKRALANKENNIQLIWYVVDAQSSRLVDFEIELLKNEFNGTPICLILSKCDVAMDDQIIGLLRAAIQANVPSLVGAYETAANPLQALDPDLEERFSVKNVVEPSYYLLGIHD